MSDIDSSIIVDLKYYSKNNFTGKFVEGYNSNKAILTKEAAINLSNVQDDLNKLGYSLILYDAYRPQSAVNFFVKWSLNFNDTINKRISIYAEKLPVFKNDTKNIIEYVEQSNDKKKKKFNFWKLLETNE